jgi:hypothetical protein
MGQRRRFGGPRICYGEVKLSRNLNAPRPTSILWPILSMTTNHKNRETSDRWLAGSVGIRDHVEKFALA